MNQANGEKVDVERQRTGTLSSGYLPTLNEKRPLVTEVKQSKMPSLRRFLFALLALSIFAVAVCSPNGVRVPRSPSPRDQRKFQELLNSIEPSSLHEVPHDHIDKYKHGVYQEDKTAVAVIHQQTPEVASSLVALAKRQEGASGNGTGIATSSTVTTTEATSTVTTPFTSTSVVTPPSDTPSSSVTEGSTTPTVRASTTSEPTSDTRSSDGSTSTKTDTTATSTPEGSPSPTDSGSNSSNPPLSSTSITSLNIYTTTLPNGTPTTITQTTIVPAGGVPDQTGGGASKTNPTASLQSNGAGAKEIGSNVVMGIIGMLFLGAL